MVFPEIEGNYILQISPKGGKAKEGLKSLFNASKYENRNVLKLKQF